MCRLQDCENFDVIVTTQMITGIICCQTSGVSKVCIFDHVRANACKYLVRRRLCAHKCMPNLHLCLLLITHIQSACFSFLCDEPKTGLITLCTICRINCIRTARDSHGIGIKPYLSAVSAAMSSSFTLHANIWSSSEWH